MRFAMPTAGPTWFRPAAKRGPMRCGTASPWHCWNLEAAQADVTRVRFALEGSRPFGLGGDALPTPTRRESSDGGAEQPREWPLDPISEGDMEVARVPSHAERSQQVQFRRGAVAATRVPSPETNPQHVRNQPAQELTDDPASGVV